MKESVQKKQGQRQANKDDEVAAGAAALHPLLAGWFRKKRWEPFEFQWEAWRAFAEGADGLVNAPTGMGKTYSVWLGPVSQWLTENADQSAWSMKDPAPPQVLWITPLRALANDTLSALRAPIEALGIARKAWR